MKLFVNTLVKYSLNLMRDAFVALKSMSFEIKDANNQVKCCVEIDAAMGVLLKGMTGKISVAGAIQSLMECLDCCVSIESTPARRLDAMAA